jgi:hypothetical protein
MTQYLLTFLVESCKGDSMAKDVTVYSNVG